MKSFTLKKLFSLMAMLSLFFSCNKNNNQISTSGGISGGGPINQNEWLLPIDQVLSGGPGKDGIPSIDNPNFVFVENVDFLEDDDLILGVKAGTEMRGYPHPILDWHEIINDDINDVSLAVTYCPLTGTGIGWNRDINGNNTTFGVSGLLYNTNLIPYDRATDSHWSQIRMDCINGNLIETKIGVVPLIETNWATWKEMYPFSRVVSTNTGFNRNYSSYPYGDYKTSSNLIFPVNNTDPALHRKQRVLGVLAEEKAKVYRFESFKTDTVNIIYDEFAGIDLVVIGSLSKEFIVVYKNELTDGSIINWTPVQDGGEEIAVDMEGNRLNIFGEVVAGPKEGERLKNVRSFMGYWFSWPAFYDTSIYE